MDLLLKQIEGATYKFTQTNKKANFPSHSRTQYIDARP